MDKFDLFKKLLSEANFKQNKIDEITEIAEQVFTCNCNTEDYELAELKEFILKEWGNCANIRQKIDWEGVDYFYNSYTDVPVSYNIYSRFARDDACWCGECI